MIVRLGADRVLCLSVRGSARVSVFVMLIVYKVSLSCSDVRLADVPCAGEVLSSTGCL